MVDALPLVDPDLSPARRLQITFELWEVGVQLRRERHRRENPAASEAELDEVVRSWLTDRPGAPFGDVAGQVRVRPV